MQTVVLRGDSVFGYHLSVRNYDGVETDYTMLNVLTNGEARSLVRAGYVEYPDAGSYAEKEENIPDPKSILQIENVHLGDTIFKSLFIRLPENIYLPRDAYECADPWFESNRRLLDEPKWRDYHVTGFTIAADEPEEWWPDNPAEAVAFW